MRSNRTRYSSTSGSFWASKYVGGIPNLLGPPILEGRVSVRSLYVLIMLTRARYSACPGKFGNRWFEFVYARRRFRIDSKSFAALLYTPSASDCFFESSTGWPIAGHMKPRWATAGKTSDATALITASIAVETVGVRKSPRARAAAGAAAYFFISMAVSDA